MIVDRIKVIIFKYLLHVLDDVFLDDRNQLLVIVVEFPDIQDNPRSEEKGTENREEVVEPPLFRQGAYDKGEGEEKNPAVKEKDLVLHPLRKAFPRFGCMQVDSGVDQKQNTYGDLGGNGHFPAVERGHPVRGQIVVSHETAPLENRFAADGAQSIEHHVNDGGGQAYAVDQPVAGLVLPVCEEIGSHRDRGDAEGEENGHADIDDNQLYRILPQEQLQGPAHEKQAEGDQEDDKVDEGGGPGLIDHDEVQKVYEEEEARYAGN